MPSYVTPKNATEYIFYIGVVSQADTNILQANPTIAAGDFQVSTDGSAFTNLDTIPAVTPASGRAIKVTLSVAEMSGDNILVVGNDAAGAEWQDIVINIQTTANQIDDLATKIDSIGASSGGSVNIEATEDNTGGAIDPSSAAFVGSVQSGTFASTEALDGTLHDIDDTANDIDIVYGFDVGGSRIATELSFEGFVQGVSDEMKIKVYDHVGADWEIIGTIPGQNGTTNVSISSALLTKHTGTSVAELGKIYIRIETDSTTPSNLSVDHLLVSAVGNAITLGFVGGAVWIDTVNGTSGTGSGVGTISVPSDNIADAKTIADSNSLRVFHILPQSSITLATNYDGYEFIGFGYTIALNGQSVSGSFFKSAIITGNDDGSNTIRTTYTGCDIDGSTLGIHNAFSCRLSGDMILAQAGDYFWDQCFSAIAGTGSPSVDFEAAAETKALNIRHYSGGMEFKNFGNTGTHTASVEGNGQVILNANCAGGTIAIRGHFPVTDNAGGAVTLSDDGRFSHDYTLTEIAQGVPNAEPTEDNAIMLMYMALRDRLDVDTSAATDYLEIYNDAGTVITKKAVSDDGTTYTEGKMETGP